MGSLKKRIASSLVGIITALSLSYSTANADLFLLKDGSKIYNYSKIKEDDDGVTLRNKEGKELYIKESELKDYIFIKEGLDDEKEIDEETAKKIEEIKIIEHWGEERLSLPVSDNFIVYDTSFKTKHVLYYCSKLELPKTYFELESCGFNTEEEALEKKKKLEAEGYDVYYRTMEASAVSPTISKTLLERKLPRKLEVVLHENMHDYVNFPIDLDEAFACVIGDFGALEYITEKLGHDSEEYKYMIQKIKKNYKDAELIIEYYNKLDGVLNLNLPEEEKIVEKERLMDELAVKRSALWGVKIEKLNNPALISFMTYSRFTPLVKKVYEKAGSVKETLKFSKELSNAVETLSAQTEDETRAYCIKHLEEYLTKP
ncbi:MAG: aminopeptidase [Nanoarchaeota archaeon]|nr:aminopeptidase [Nanoarchaeota archaeon]